MAEEFVSAFRDMQKDAANNEKLVEFVRSHYANSLNAPDFCSVLQRQRPLNPTIDLIPPFIFHNFFHDLYRLYEEYLMLYEKLKPTDECLRKQLRYIAVCKKASAVFFITAAMICAMAAAAMKANADPKMGPAAGVASLVLGALGKLFHSLLSKRENSVERHKEITKLMIMGDIFGIKDLTNIHAVALTLQFETESLSETGLLRNKFDELLWRVEYYIGEMKWVKQLVIESIIKL